MSKEKKSSKKPQFAFYWAASCGGCEIAVLDIDEKILDERKFKWKRPKLKYNRGILSLYPKLVSSAKYGAVLNIKNEENQDNEDN